MHDPMVVAHEIHAPIPKRDKWRERDGLRWSLKRRRYTGGGPKFVGKPMRHWFRPAAWEPVAIAGRRYSMRTVATVWHVEPNGRDSGSVCRHSVRSDDWPSRWRIRLNPFLKMLPGTDEGPPWVVNRAWKWHVHHWHIQVHLQQKVRRFLLERCEECGRRFPWGYAPVSHQWDSPGSRWRDGITKRAYHHECSSLVVSRQTRGTDERLIRSLFAAFRLATDESEPDLLGRLTDPKLRSMEFGDAFRLTRLLGYDRNDAYELVPAGSEEDRK